MSFRDLILKCKKFLLFTYTLGIFYGSFQSKVFALSCNPPQDYLVIRCDSSTCTDGFFLIEKRTGLFRCGTMQKIKEVYPYNYAARSKNDSDDSVSEIYSKLNECKKLDLVEGIYKINFFPLTFDSESPIKCQFDERIQVLKVSDQFTEETLEKYKSSQEKQIIKELIKEYFIFIGLLSFIVFLSYKAITYPFRQVKSDSIAPHKAKYIFLSIFLKLVSVGFLFIMMSFLMWTKLYRIVQVVLALTLLSILINPIFILLKKSEV